MSARAMRQLARFVFAEKRAQLPRRVCRETVAQVFLHVGRLFDEDSLETRFAVRQLACHVLGELEAEPGELAHLEVLLPYAEDGLHFR